MGHFSSSYVSQALADLSTWASVYEGEATCQARSEAFWKLTGIQISRLETMRLKRIGHPVRSAIHKLQIGGLVVGWVTTSESPLLLKN
ncbi:hypothetical protein BofuT4_P016140.1 [Botrytis cinerea T4]|uniref:Uncharacterized protein n=1 Tax=Botryotinia fuckeliana (strain T4) TaxID=999810 RepID=G2YHX1_BOTF4|nr:hypothetical protein BofuT4_P016140.1 [Botrytis cinerea T4]